ncbi:arsenate reductase (glutaredoxin) [Litorisediminicola beolgyonensis]|uniref:Arsenate reductase n=1 Tax=Litorisediminicola beolgyonensis TaxID=1173614 RepID=A0ABW3ZDW8_9RHOB
MALTLWHNPRCSKSRAALALLEARGAKVTFRRYLEDAPDRQEIEAALAALDVPAADLLRFGEAEAKARGLTRDSAPEALIAAMAEVPKLIERPVLFAGSRAVIGRPPERVLTLLD